MDTLKSLADKIYSEITPVKSELENMVTHLMHANSSPEERTREVIEQMEKQVSVEDLLGKYELHLTQIQDMNSECVRLANIASTRMGAVQQDLNEDWEAVGQLCELLRESQGLAAKLEAVKKQTEQLHHHFLQTQLATEVLERALHANTFSE